MVDIPECAPHVVTTVLGDVAVSELGRCLFHEHLLMDLSAHRDGDQDVVLDDPALLASELRFLAEAGVTTIVDATTPDIGRDVRKLVEAAGASGTHVVAGTGLHHAATYPADLVEDTAALAAWMVAEATEGIDGSEVRAGVIGELGTRDTEFTRAERVVFTAAARAQAQTGLAIITHTAEGALAREQVAFLAEQGADPSRVAIGHLDCARDFDLALAVARDGAWVGVDRCGIEWMQSDDFRVRLVLELVEAGYADRVLLSSDLGRRSRLRANGGTGLAMVPSHFVPRLLAAGLEPDAAERMLTVNPQRFLGVPRTADRTAS